MRLRTTIILGGLGLAAGMLLQACAGDRTLERPAASRALMGPVDNNSSESEIRGYANSDYEPMTLVRVGFPNKPDEPFQVTTILDTVVVQTQPATVKPSTTTKPVTPVITPTARPAPDDSAPR
jgi:hypothetical protein